MITIEQIRRFLTVAEYMNFTKAAEALYISTSTLSKSISDMEADLGVPLFYRARNGILLTPAGEILLAEGNSVIAHVIGLEQKLTIASQNSSATLRISGRNIISQQLIQLYRQFSASFPEDQYKIVDKQKYGETGQALDSGDIDLGIFINMELAGEASTFQLYNLEECSCVAVVCGFHPLAGRTEITCAELREQNCISSLVSQGISKRADVIEYEERFGFKEHVENDETLFTKIRTGMGIGIMPEPVFKYSCNDLIALKIPDHNIPMYVTLAWKRDNTNKALQHFLALLP